MKIGALIQARLGSTRLPKKVLMDLAGKTVLERVVERVKSSKLINEVIVATTDNDEDKEIVKLADKINVSVYVGSEEDVLDRYYQAAKKFKLDNVVRITADSPLIDPAIIDSILKLHLDSKADYTSNTIKETYPDGEDVEAFTFRALEKSWKEAGLSSEREHVTPYIRKQSSNFKLSSMEYKENLAEKRWTLDEQKDYEFIKTIYENLKQDNKISSMEEILDYLKRNPKIEKINQGIIRNEGYIKSLKNDEIVKG